MRLILSSSFLALAFASSCGTVPVETKGPPARTTAAPAGPAAGAAAETSRESAPEATGAPAADPGEIAALQKRVAELEAALKEAEKAGPPAGGPSGAASAPTASPQLANPAALMAILDRRDGPAMEREVEALLLAGAPGFAVLHDFFHQADIDHEKILILTHDPQLLYALLHLVALHPDDVAALSNYLMEATADRPQSFIRREVFNFVPVFLNHHKGKYPELRERLKNEIDLQIEKGAYYLDKVFLAMRDLGHSSPVPPLAALLDDPQKKEMHPTIIDHLANRGPDGMAALVAFAQEGKNPQLPSLGLALKAIAAKSEGGKTAEFRRFLEHPAPAVRLTALRVYFEFPRDLDDLPLARQFLDSETGLGSKRSFIAALRRRNGHLLDALASEPDRIALAEVRVLVEREAAAAQAQKQRGASPPSVPSPRAR